jgi:hypothetical protein
LCRSIEFQTLQFCFSSGVRLRELVSVALVIADLGEIAAPGRRAKRHFDLLMDWYRQNWAVVAVWLPYVQLRDANDLSIDSRREVSERKMG